MDAPQKSRSQRRDEVFRPSVKPQYILNGERWPDFYAILEVPERATGAEIEDAIIEASSQLLAVSFTRGTTHRLQLVEQFTNDFRVVLLDAKRRARYDHLLGQHRKNDDGAIPYADFYAGEWGENLLQRARRKARTVGERLVTTWRDSPYI